MKALAQFAMSGRRQAILAALLLGLLPVFNFLSAPVVALVALRHGRDEALKVLVWAVLPALGWSVLGDAMPLLTLLGITVLALVLRSTGSWQATLLASIGVGIASLLGLYLQSGVLAIMEQQFLQLLQQLANAPEFQGQLEVPDAETLHRMVVMFFAVSVTFTTVTLLMLARSWQAALYNPGGFREEFHQLRMSSRASAVLFALFVLTTFGPPITQQLALFFMLPLLIAGVALVHGLVGRRKLPVAVLVVFYAFLLFPTMLQVLVLAALADSWLDFRSKVPARE